MLITTEDEAKLEIVKDYNPRELRLILDFLEGGLFCDSVGQPYTPTYLKKCANRYSTDEFWENNNG